MCFYKYCKKIWGVLGFDQIPREPRHKTPIVSVRRHLNDMLSISFDTHIINYES